MANDEIRDGDWKLFSYDPLYRRQVWVMHDHENGAMHFRIDYEVEGLLEQNKEAYNEASRGWKGDYLHHIAKVPLNLWYDKLEQMKGDPKALDRWLNDPNNRAFRTKKGWDRLMALSTRNDLKNAVISWLYARTDVEANFDDFVTMTEEMLNHGAEDMQALRCRDMVTSADIVMTDGVGSLPSDFLQLRYASDVTASPQRVLDYMTPDAANWTYPSAASGPGINFGIQGTSLTAQPNVSGTVRLLYYAAIPALTVTADINWLLTRHPSIYLRGCLLQAAEWLKDDNETMKQGVLFSKLVNGLNKSDMIGQYARASTMIAGLVI